MARTLFTNVLIFDGSGAPSFPGEVLVEDTKIAALTGNSGDFAPGDALVVDGGGATLMPGFCDAHAHLAFGSTVEQINRPGHRSDEETALLVAHCGRVLLDYGFTSAVSGGSGSAVAEIAAAKAFEAGWVPGPRLKTSSFERTPGGAMGLKTVFPGAASREANPDEVTAFVEEMADIGVDAVKFLLNGVSAFHPGANLVGQFHESEIAAAGRAARARGVRLTAHTYTPDMIKSALNNGFSLLYHCNYADEASLDAIEAHRDSVFIGPAPGIAEADLIRAPKFGIMASDADRAEQADAVEHIKWMGAELRKRGIRSLPGGDYGFPWNPIGLNGRDIQLFVEWFGYSPAEALRSATKLGGELMGMSDRLGLVAENYLADLLLIDGDPTRDIGIVTDRTKFLAIMKDGKFHRAPPEQLVDHPAA